MAILLLIIFIIVIGSKVVYKDNFATVEGKITTSGSNGEKTISVNYPSGFNQNNTVVIAVQFDIDNSSVIWGTGASFMSASYVAGSLPANVELNPSNIRINVRNIIISSTGTVDVSSLSSDLNYKLVLMKIGD